MEITVDVLLRLPFQSLNYDLKKVIVVHGKPRPWLNWCTLYPNGSRLIFDASSYDRISWLTGSAQRQKLFCWPCLLFNTAFVGSWNNYGVPNSSCLLKYILMHEKTPAHIQSCVDLQLFRMQIKNSTNIHVLQVEPILQTRANVVSKNRETLKHLIDLVCHCVTKIQLPDSRNYSCQLKIDYCVEMMQLVRSYDIRTRKEIDSAIQLIKDSPEFLNDIVNSITKVVKNSIKKETQMSTYVSLILNNHCNTTDKLLISTILHYLKNGQVCERVVGFYNLKPSELDNGVEEHITKIISEFDISERLLAYSIDGGILKKNHLSYFVKFVMKINYPFTFFLPWHAHELKKVLKRSLSNVKEYNIFFKTLTAIQNFFQKHRRRWKAYEKFVGVAHFEMKIMPSSCENEMWFDRSEATQVVCSYRKYFIEFFDSILQNCERWDTEDVAQVSGFHQYLEESLTVFLLHAFSAVFKLTLSYDLYLKRKTPEQIFSSLLSETLKDNLRNGKLFEEVWANFLADVENKKPNGFPKSFIVPSTSEYSRHFRKIIDFIVLEMDTRFGELGSLEFCSLLTHDVCTEDDKARYFQKLHKAHGQYFNEEEILAELSILKLYPTIPQNSVDALFHFFVEANLRRPLPTVYQLTELAMTLPTRRCKTGVAGAAKLNKIPSCAYRPDEGTISGDVGMLFVESEYVKELKKCASFYDAVIESLFGINKTVELF